MEHNNILSILWQNEEKYGIIDEELLAENTFIQQTSCGENLWKAQLGITDNFIIFLRCYTSLILNNNSNNNLLPEEINILINMIPMSHLKVRKHRKRTIEVIFPSDIVCYFTLLLGDGCGKAWSQWKALEQVCGIDTSPLVPVSILIPFLKLNRKLQKIMIADQFARCFADISKYSLETANSVQRIYATDETKSRRITVEELKPDVNLQQEDTSKSLKRKEKINTESSLDENVKILRRSSSDKKDRKTRQIRRFGEGIPENCIFDLTLSYNDELAVDESHEIDNDDDDNGDDDVLHDIISLDERASRMICRTLTDSSVIEKQESVKESSKEKLHDKIYLEEQFFKMFGKNFNDSPKIDEKKPVKIPPNKNQRKIRNGKKKNDNIKMNQIFTTAQFFTNVSSLVIPDGLRTSKSVDSIRQIQATKCHKIFVTRNVSLPDINEMLFYQRHGRLNYSMDYFESKTEMMRSKNHYSHPISFWLPDKKSTGRVYCTEPICRKISAEKVYSAKQNAQRMNLKGKKRPKTSVQNDLVYNEDKNRKSQLIRKQKSKGHNSANITANQFQGREPEKESCEILEASANHAENEEEEIALTGKTVKPNIEKNTWRQMDPSALEPYRVAHELHMIQQTMFCEIESSEWMRYILKPYTVTEVTCPYLCGFLFYFERLKNLVVTDLSAQRDARETARKYELYEEIALECLRRKDEQSAYAIMSGLCNPKTFYNKTLWTYIQEKEDEVTNNLMNLFKMWYSKRKLPIIHKKIPFFLDFITFIMKNAMKMCSFPNTESNSRYKKVFSEFTVLSYGNYERIIEAIEESRNYFLFEEENLKSDIFTREYLLYKQF